MSPAALVAESFRNARSARTYSTLFGAVTLIAVAAVIVLMAQAGAQRAGVLATFSRPEYRTVEIVDTEGLGLIDWGAARQAERLSAVQSAWALGAAFDVANGALPDRGRVAAQGFSGSWTSLPIRLVSGRLPHGDGEALVSVTTAADLGMDASGGWLAGPSGRTWAVVGTYAPGYRGAPDSALVPVATSTKVRALALTVDRLDHVDDVVRAARSLTSAGPGSDAQLAVTTNGDARQLDQAISSAVGDSGTTIVVTVMAAAFGVLTFLAVLMVYARRQEFGRRRALGATREAVVGLVLVQGGVVVSVAAIAGAGLGWVVARFWLDYAVAPAFLGAVALTAVCGSALAQMPSALAAGFRDPVRVLRTP